MTFPEIIELVRGRWTDAVIEETCVTIRVAENDGPVTLRVSHSPEWNELGFVVDVADAEGITFDELRAAAGELARGSLLVSGDRILVSDRLPCSDFTGVELLRFIRSLAARATSIRARIAPPPRIAA
jgi:hypothetical protein